MVSIIEEFKKKISNKSDEDIKNIFEEIMKEIQLQQQLQQQLQHNNDDDIDGDNLQLLQRSVTSIENTYSQLVAAIIYSGLPTDPKSLSALLIPQE